MSQHERLFLSPPVANTEVPPGSSSRRPPAWRCDQFGAFIHRTFGRVFWDRVVLAADRGHRCSQFKEYEAIIFVRMP